MTPLIDCGEFMDRLEAPGVAFALDGDRLAITTPPGALTAEHRAELSQRKEVIARLVRSAGVAVQLTMGEAA